MAGKAADDLSRVPPAPRTPSPRARLLVVNVGFAQGFLLVLGSTFSILGILGFLRQWAQMPIAKIELSPLVFPIGGFLMLVVGFLGHRRRRRAFTHGTPALGWIVSFGRDPRASTETRDGRRPTVLTWAFHGPGGQLGGSVSSLDRGLFGERHIGAPVIVLFDPKHPEVNTLWVE
jgi:hypothetical protein